MMKMLTSLNFICKIFGSAHDAEQAKYKHEKGVAGLHLKTCMFGLCFPSESASKAISLVSEMKVNSTNGQGLLKRILKQTSYMKFSLYLIKDLGQQEGGEALYPHLRITDEIKRLKELLLSEEFLDLKHKINSPRKQPNIRSFNYQHQNTLDFFVELSYILKYSEQIHIFKEIETIYSTIQKLFKEKNIMGYKVLICASLRCNVELDEECIFNLYRSFSNDKDGIVFISKYCDNNELMDVIENKFKELRRKQGIQISDEEYKKYVSGEMSLNLGYLNGNGENEGGYEKIEYLSLIDNHTIQ